MAEQGVSVSVGVGDENAESGGVTTDEEETSTSGAREVDERIQSALNIRDYALAAKLQDENRRGRMRSDLQNKVAAGWRGEELVETSKLDSLVRTAKARDRAVNACDYREAAFLDHVLNEMDDLLAMCQLIESALTPSKGVLDGDLAGMSRRVPAPCMLALATDLSFPLLKRLSSKRSRPWKACP